GSVGFSRQAVSPERVRALRANWRIPPGYRVVLVPGRVAPWNGQIMLPDIARALQDEGRRGVAFVIVGEIQSHSQYAQAILSEARAQGVDRLFRLAGHCRDLPAAFAASEIVVVPAIEAPTLGTIVAQAQAMARPVITSNLGVLPEQIVAPPRMPEELRTGWVARAGDPLDFARLLGIALALDDTAYQAMTARAREFAVYMFSPQSVAVATRAVHTSLLARDL